MKYRKTRNKVTQMLRWAKRQFFMSLSTSDNKKFWKTIKVLSKSQCTIPSLSNNGTTATTDRDKSNMLNNYFAI